MAVSVFFLLLFHQTYSTYLVFEYICIKPQIERPGGKRESVIFFLELNIAKTAPNFACKFTCVKQCPVFFLLV